jgi:hypothetical protein
MKRDTSNESIIDLDLYFKTRKPSEIVTEVKDFNKQLIDWDEVLLEWSYRLPKGYPTVVDGVFTDAEEVKILNEILQERVEGVELPIEEVVDASQLSSNPTDVKEAMVCLFMDVALTDKTLIDLYRSGLDKKMDPAQRAKVAKTLRTKLTTIAKTYGKNYGIPGYAKMGDYVSDAIGDIAAHKGDLVIINNGVGAATAIVNKFKQIQPGMVRRDTVFNAIRSHAVKLIESNYNLKGYYPDNWCPGDIYVFLNEAKAKKALETKRLNVGAGSLNDLFYGSANPKAPILAISLKMQQAQAGKGTTFIKNVVVDGVTAEDKLGKDTSNQQIIKFRDLNRRLQKYYFTSDSWKKDAKIFGKVRQAVIQLSKMANLQNIPAKPTETKELAKYLATNQAAIEKAVKTVTDTLGKSTDTATTFQQAYTRFVTNLKALKIDKVGGNSRDFLKSIESKNKTDNGGKLDAGKLQALLSQKAATYDLASTLIEKWTEKTKQVSPAFADYLDKVKNPFIAITMFAIAQHGLNPNFYKAIGTNNATTGTISEFPSNSTVDEKKSVQNLEVIDSPGQAGFYISYLLTINSHTYKTSLVFRFSKDQIRIEVEELKSI